MTEAPKPDLPEEDADDSSPLLRKAAARMARHAEAAEKLASEMPRKVKSPSRGPRKQS